MFVLCHIIHDCCQFLSQEPFQTEMFFGNHENWFEIWPGFTHGRVPALKGTCGLLLKLCKYDLIVFQATVQHRGAAFAGWNVRVHKFWESIHLLRNTDSAFWVGVKSDDFECSFVCFDFSHIYVTWTQAKMMKAT